MAIERLTYLCVLALLTAVISAGRLSAQTDSSSDTLRLADGRLAIAVLPFANYTGDQGALTIVPLIEQGLWRDDFYVVRSPRVRRTLRQERIRTAGMIRSEDARLLAERWEVDYLLLGSLDVYREDALPEAAFSLRLVEARTMQIVWAKTVAATGADFTGFLGLGRITNMPALLRALVKEAIGDAHKSVKQHEADPGERASGNKLAVVVFDNQSSNRRGGEIISSMLVARLWNKSIQVIEPGDVIDVFQGRSLQARGEVMNEILSSLRDEHGVDLVLTGSVEEFQPGRGSTGRSYPTLLVSGRLISTESGLVVAAREYYRRGGDSELVLGLGVKRALGDLSTGVLDDLIEDLYADAQNNFATRR